MMCLAANGATPNTTLLSACTPSLDANMGSVPADSSLIRQPRSAPSSDGRKRRMLWDSQDWHLGFSSRKPVIADGKLDLPTYDARIDVYGLVQDGLARRRPGCATHLGKDQIPIRESDPGLHSLKLP